MLEFLFMLLKASSVSNCSFTVDKLAAVCFHNTAIVIHFPIIMKKSKKVYLKKKKKTNQQQITLLQK